MKCFSSNSKGASLRIHHSVVSVNDAWDISYSPPICPSSICMFTGELPGKRKINLGGRAVTADKQALLEQTRREREERERARKRTESVIRIGRIYRGHLTRRKCKYSLIELLNHTHDTRVGNTHILSILFLLNRLGYIVEEPLLRSISALYENTVPNSIDIVWVVRVSALVQQVLRYPSLCQQYKAIIGRLIGVSQSFLPHMSSDMLTLVRLLDVGDCIRLMSALLDDRGTERELLKRFSLLFLQEKVTAETLPSGLIDVVVRIPVMSFDYAKMDAVISIKRVCLNLVSIIFNNNTLIRQLMLRLQSLVVHLSESDRSDFDSYVVSHLLDRRAAVGDHVLLELVRLETLSDETIYRLATQTSLVEQIGGELVLQFLHGSAGDGRIPSLVGTFTLLYSKVVGGISSGYTSVLSTKCLESLFPLLNKYAYESVVRFEPVGDTVFDLIRSVYGKKHMYPHLRNDEVWTVPDSVSFIPHTIHGYDLTVHSEEDIEIFHEEEKRSSPETTGHKSVFDVLMESMPHVIPFHRRLRIFASALAEDQLRHTRQAWAMRLPWESSRVKRVRRQYLLEDGLEVISNASREVLRIEFVSSDGSVEAGIDGGGLFKEFMQRWTIGLMNPDFGLFVQLPNGRLSPSVDAYRIHPDADRLFKAAGRAVGKALYEMVLLETHLGEAFLNRVLGRPFSLDQLSEIDESLYRNLKFVNECDSVEDLSLSFSVSSGGAVDHELVPNGSDLPVTSSNKIRYVLLASWYYLARQLDRPAAAFAAGLSELLPLKRLGLFSPSEINLLVSGEQKKGFDVIELKANVVYGGGYSEHSKTVKLLWDLLLEFTDDDRSAFLAFVTSAPRPPLLGFRVLHPKFGINRVPEPDRLPTSSTCANLLKLPDYQDKALLKAKLLAAIYSQSGFDLS